jgi:hypothetical protein
MFERNFGRRLAALWPVLPIMALSLAGQTFGAERKESIGEAKFPGEKWKLVNVVTISGDALKFALGKEGKVDFKGDNIQLDFGENGDDRGDIGKVIIREYNRQEQKAQAEEIMSFYRDRIKQPGIEPIVKVASPEDCEALEVYVSQVNKSGTSQFCMVSVDSVTVTLIEIESKMIDDVLKSLGGSMESISDSIRKDMEKQRKDAEKMRKALEKERRVIITNKGDLDKDLKDLEREAERLKKQNEELKKELEKLRKEREKP